MKSNAAPKSGTISWPNTIFCIRKKSSRKPENLIAIRLI